jgi:hypothetical protein
VSAGVGVAPNQPIDLRNFRTLIALTTGIIQHETAAFLMRPRSLSKV